MRKYNKSVIPNDSNILYGGVLTEELAKFMFSGGARKPPNVYLCFHNALKINNSDKWYLWWIHLISILMDKSMSLLSVKISQDILKAE